MVGIPLVTGDYDIQQLPTLVLFSGGAEAGRAVGYRSEAVARSALAEVESKTH